MVAKHDGSGNAEIIAGRRKPTETQIDGTRVRKAWRS